MALTAKDLRPAKDLQAWSEVLGPSDFSVMGDTCHDGLLPPAMHCFMDIASKPFQLMKTHVSFHQGAARIGVFLLEPQNKLFNQLE